MTRTELANGLRRMEGYPGHDENGVDKVLGIWANVFQDDSLFNETIERAESVAEFIDIANSAIMYRMAEAARNCELVVTTDRGTFEAPMLEMFPVDPDKPDGEFVMLFRPIGGHVESCRLRLPILGREAQPEIPFERINRNHFCKAIRQKVWLGPIWKSEPVSIVKAEPAGMVLLRSVFTLSCSLREC